MAGSWRLLRLVRLILLACGLHFSSDQPVNCSHGSFDSKEGARLHPERNLSKDLGQINHPLARPWKSADSDTRGQLSHESTWVSRRLLVQHIWNTSPPELAPAPAQLPAPTPSSLEPPLLPPPLQPSLPPSLVFSPTPTQLPPTSPLFAPLQAPSEFSPGPSQFPPESLSPLFTPASAPAPSLEDLERQAVLYFKGELTADPTGVFKQWNDSNNLNLCNWNGIKCGDGGENFGRVTSISLPNCKLEGVLTSYIQDLPYLETLDLGGNMISGPIPEEIGTLEHLRILRLNGNSFPGTFPQSLSSCLQIEELDLQGCGLYDAFPKMLQHRTSLTSLNLGDNSFTGPIPIWLGWSPVLRYLHLGGNEFTGDLPISLLNCTSLQFLNISSNNLTGSVDSMVGNLVSLQTHLDMSHNQFSGLIPLELGNLQDLLGLNLSGNSFTGSIPQSIGNFSKLQSLDLSGNQLSGSLPEALSLLSNVKHILNLSHNALEGIIPSSLGELQNLTKLDLSYNKLSGPLPGSIGNMGSLVFLNVSMNLLVGRVPDTGSFRNLSSDSFLGNLELCGRVVGRPCPEEVVTVSGYHRKGLTLVTILGAAVEGVVLLVFAILLVRYLVHRGAPEQGSETHVVLFSKYFKALKLTVEEIQAAMAFTDSSGSLTFSRTLSGNIRRGVGFSNIEKAVLPDGTVFAVKQWCIAKFRRKDRHRLDAEMLNFGKIRHRNLVRLMGYYMNPTTLVMLMEFMPNGSLDLHLHPPGQPTCQLKWDERLRIIMGITTGLVYLHNKAPGSAVVHCDLKASNVLLDSDMEPKLVDFGMPRLIKRNSKGSTAASWIGSSGYAPPEYGFSSEVTTAGDVYSYGVLLLEIITGKRPTSEEVGVGVTLPTWVRSLRAQDREQYAIAMSLFQSSDEAQINQILHILRAAILCTSHVPAARPSMLEVLSNLQEMPESVVEEELVPVEAPVDPSQHR